jgi:hypothetical protein
LGDPTPPVVNEGWELAAPVVNNGGTTALILKREENSVSISHSLLVQMVSLAVSIRHQKFQNVSNMPVRQG